MPLLHHSIAKIPEKELVAHVLNDVQYRDTLFNIKGMFTKGARVLEQIELRCFRKDLAGEIDILVVPAGQPELSTAIQVKRFKAVVRIDEQGFDDAEVGHPKRFEELMAKGVQQANETKRVGFAQVYLWIFVVTDTRARNNGWCAAEEHWIRPAAMSLTIRADLPKLKTLLSRGFRATGVQVTFNADPNNPGAVLPHAVVSVEKGKDVLKLESDDLDFSMYSLSLKAARDQAGTRQLRPIADSNKYWDEMEQLCHDADAKREAAFKRLDSGAFRFGYNPQSLLTKVSSVSRLGVAGVHVA